MNHQASPRAGVLNDAERQILRRTGVDEATYLAARAAGEADPAHPRALPPLAPALNHQYPSALSRAELDICERAGIEPAEYLAAQQNP